jgi:hypothetical protein
MAVEVESANLVRQKVKLSLQNASPVAQAAFDGLHKYLATQGNNPDLQFIAVSDALLTTSTGYSPIGAACKLYGVYFKKNGTSGTGTGTDSWLTIANDASNVTDTTKFVALMTSVSNDEVFAVYPAGLPFGTDLTLSGETSAQDGTESTAGDSGSCFVIIGAA